MTVFSINRSMSGTAGVLAILLAGGTTLGADVVDSEARLAKAREAYESALAELRAAEAAAAQESPAPNASSAVATGAGSVVTQPDEVPPQEVAPAAEPGFFAWDAWDKSVDIGVNGASGNSENLNLRLQLSAERITTKMETKTAALYRMAQQDSETTENRFRFDVFNDWLPPEGSKIRWWAKGAYEFDDFQAWDHRVSASGGIGYELINNDKHTLVGRLGFGGSQTFGDEEEFRPEAIAGLDYSFQIATNQKLTAGTEFLLDVSDTDQWRNNSFVQFEALIDESSGMNFKTGISNRYDSAPGGDADKNDLEYFATLGWKF